MITGGTSSKRYPGTVKVLGYRSKRVAPLHPTNISFQELQRRPLHSHRRSSPLTILGNGASPGEQPDCFLLPHLFHQGYRGSPIHGTMGLPSKVACGSHQKSPESASKGAKAQYKKRITPELHTTQDRIFDVAKMQRTDL
eukprot:jgi/Botrbrau1/12995/Bobra.384_1s0019.1